MASKLFYWFVVITIWPRPFVDTTRMLRLNVAIFLRLLLIRYNSYTELLSSLRSQLKLMASATTFKDKLSELQQAQLRLLISDLAKVIEKRRIRADSIEWELSELWNTPNIHKRVRAICTFIINGNKCTEVEPAVYFKRLTRPHYIIFKSRKFITRDLAFTVIS